MHESDTVETTAESKPRKGSRKSYKSQMTEQQESVLKRYFTEKTHYPKHAEKKMLSEKSGVDPFLINKWFQRERNRNKKKTNIADRQKPTVQIRKEEARVAAV